MHAQHFDALTRSLTGTGSRRRAVALALSGALGSALGASSVQEVGAKKTKKPKPNSFGCLNVGQKCRGKDSTCCSGVCKGKKPKKGKKDKRTCAAHNAGICTPELDLCTTGLIRHAVPRAPACAPPGMPASVATSRTWTTRAGTARRTRTVKRSLGQGRHASFSGANVLRCFAQTPAALPVFPPASDQRRRAAWMLTASTVWPGRLMPATKRGDCCQPPNS